MNDYRRFTAQDEQIAAEMNEVFSDQLNQFEGICTALHNAEDNLSAIGNAAFKAALLSPGHIIRTDDGTEWRHDIDLMKNISVCHRRVAGKIEFAIVEFLPFPLAGTKEVLTSGHNVRDVLREFIRDQKQVLNFWKDDVKAQVGEHLEENYPHQDMSAVIESFEIKMARAIMERKLLAQSRGIRI